MPDALYYSKPHQLEFTASVTGVDGQQVALSATAFYPEGGGQNPDLGKLVWDGGEAGLVEGAVTDTQKDKASGEIWHTLSGPVPSVGDEVRGEVDAGVRWRHEQRHSGEHLLAAAFHKLNPAFAVQAVGMRGPECTLDLAGQPSESDVRAAEALLRETLGRTPLKLRTSEVSEAELDRYPLRRTTKITGTVRLVIFEEERSENVNGVPFDVSACGGLHVPWAAMASPVTVLRTERLKGDLTRVVFMAGEEAAARLAETYQASRALAATFSSGPTDLSARVEVLRRQAREAEAQLASLRTALIRREIAAAPLEHFGTASLRALRLDDIAMLPVALSAVPDGELLVVTTAARRVGLARGAGLDLHVGELLRSALSVSGGKGGGKADSAQGQTEDVTAFVGAVRTVLGNPN
ncbi:alanyl-tRNA editing protein [Deinococcus sp.]|uniref:alanyl-tRNA editing protein n=1 Tax=Deinococcus sp. TaxID=47478 RepID=UPI0025D034D6|nr:alanyl-tRNA editing protein [Deinococcus sp.]